MASFDFAPLALRYAQDEREIGLLLRVGRPAVEDWDGYAQDEREIGLLPFVLSVAKRKRSEVEGRHDF